jgi:DNA repair exonuclease SbcCD nuclease subunit
MTGPAEDEIVLKLLHTADWHLGRRFPRFGDEAQRKLTRARLEVIERILRAAERNVVHAVLCAGDLFDEPAPDRQWWEGLAQLFARLSWKDRPVFLLPGNHDPLTLDSIWMKEQFRQLLPGFVHIVDRDDFQYALGDNAVLYAVPCTSRAGQNDPTEKIPARAPGDARIRIGLVHGSTFDAADCQTNFPIHADAALLRGLDYLAIGDTHGFRLVPPDRPRPPTIYPGSPEPTAYDEKDPGHVAIVLMTRSREARWQKERVAYWTWEDARVETLDELRALARRSDLHNRVLRLSVQMRLPAAELEEAERLLEELSGTDAKHGKVGVLELDRSQLAFDAQSVKSFSAQLPAVLQATFERLQAATESPLDREREVAERAIYHLYRLLRKAG